MKSKPQHLIQLSSANLAQVDIQWSREARQKAMKLSAGIAPENANSPSRSFSVREPNHVARVALRRTLQIVPPRSTGPALALAPAESSTRLEISPEISLLFVSDEEMRVLNLQYRGKDKPTDVLSWSQDEGEEFPPGLGFEAENVLGDIAISVETAHRQARERHHSLEREIEFLCIHGALHLLGYDHQTSAERRAMWAHQEKMVALLQNS